MGCQECVAQMSNPQGVPCKIISTLLVAAGLAIIIGGAVMINLNKQYVANSNYTGPEAMDYFAGLGMCALGSVIFICSVISCGCAFKNLCSAK